MSRYRVYTATGLEPGLTYQVAENLDRGDESLVIEEGLFDLLFPMIARACPEVDPYGLTTITNEAWRELASDIARSIDEIAGAAGDDGVQVASNLRTIIRWLTDRAGNEGSLTLYGI